MDNMMEDFNLDLTQIDSVMENPEELDPEPMQKADPLKAIKGLPPTLPASLPAVLETAPPTPLMLEEAPFSRFPASTTLGISEMDSGSGLVAIDLPAADTNPADWAVEQYPGVNLDGPTAAKLREEAPPARFPASTTLDISEMDLGSALVTSPPEDLPTGRADSADWAVEQYPGMNPDGPTAIERQEDASPAGFPASTTLDMLDMREMDSTRALLAIPPKDLPAAHADPAHWTAEQHPGMNPDDPIAIKLFLAGKHLSMGDRTGASILLDEVLQAGSGAQKQAAREMLMQF